jgi:hypothetical protein
MIATKETGVCQLHTHGKARDPKNSNKELRDEKKAVKIV